MKMLTVFELIRWLKGKATKEQILPLSQQKNVSAAELDLILALLIKKKAIKCQNTQWTALTDQLFGEEGGADAAAQVKMYQMFADFRKKNRLSKKSDGL